MLNPIHDLRLSMDVELFQKVRYTEANLSVNWGILKLGYTQTDIHLKTAYILSVCYVHCYGIPKHCAQCPNILGNSVKMIILVGTYVLQLSKYWPGIVRNCPGRVYPAHMQVGYKWMKYCSAMHCQTTFRYNVNSSVWAKIYHTG